MEVDVVLWFILAGMFALIVCGCVMTGAGKKPPRAAASAFDYETDRTA